MSRFSAELLNIGFATGIASYWDAYPGQESAARIVIPLLVATNLRIHAILDTGAPWCVFDPRMAKSFIEDDQNPLFSPVRLLIRGQWYSGSLYRIPCQLIAEIGESLDVEATVFVPQLRAGESWPHPNFIGLDGFLNRLRIAIDPAENALYFGPV
jgi:hypothetical protein